MIKLATILLNGIPLHRLLGLIAIKQIVSLFKKNTNQHVHPLIFYWQSHKPTNLRIHSPTSLFAFITSSGDIFFSTNSLFLFAALSPFISPR